MTKQSGVSLLILLLMLTRFRTGARPLTRAQLLELARRSGFAVPEVAVAVALAESGGHPDAVGDFGRSYGLWQIHGPAHPQYSAWQLLDAEYNAHAAFEISKGGTDWSPWTTFRNGDYRRFMGGES
jgi:hypothetical protein